MKAAIDRILEQAYGEEIAEHILLAYQEVLDSYSLEKWKTTELDAGHFVEMARRIIEMELTGSYTPIGKSLSKFDDRTLKSYESQHGDDSFRILIPRVLWGIYTVRNKRGVGHVGKVKPNEIDATLLVAAVKWTLSEIIRCKSTLSIKETTDLVSALVERQIPILWKAKDVRRILNPKMSAKNQVLILLYDKSPSTENDLRSAIEYRNVSDFRSKVLKPLHTNRLIEFDVNKGLCRILPTGIAEAERVMLSSDR